MTFKPVPMDGKGCDVDAPVPALPDAAAALLFALLTMWMVLPFCSVSSVHTEWLSSYCS